MDASQLFGSHVRDEKSNETRPMDPLSTSATPSAPPAVNTLSATDSERLDEQRLLESLKPPTFRFPQPSPFSIVWYGAWISLAALLIAHTSWNAGAEIGLLNNRIAIAGVTQAQAGNQIQLLQLCLANSTLLAEACESILADAPARLLNLTESATINYQDITIQNTGIAAQVIQQLEGFHGTFFGLAGISLIHFICALRRPVTRYLRERSVYRRCVGKKHDPLDLLMIATTQRRRRNWKEVDEGYQGGV